MRLTRLRLNGSSQLIPGSYLDIPIPSANTVIFLGGNGTGKSLLTTALLTALGPIGQRESLTQELAQAGVTQLLCEFQLDRWSAQLSYDFTTAERRVDWTRRTPGWSALALASIAHEDDPHPALAEFLLPHVVLAGQLAMPLDESLIESLRRLVRIPGERELATWTNRLAALTGESGDGGTLAATQAAVDQISTSLERVERAVLDLERERGRQNELTLHLADLIATGEMLKAECEELQKIVRLADRAVRVHNWIEEIRDSQRTVADTRERSAQLTASLRHLENKFAAVPPNLPDLVHSYVAARNLEHELRSQLDVVQNDQQLARSALETVQLELAALREPDLKPQRDDELSLRSEIARMDERLVALQRGRIELVRLRDGLANQVLHDFADLAALDDDGQTTLQRFLDLKLSAAAQSEIADAVAAEDNHRRDSRRRDLKSTINREFAGFDRLAPTTPDLLAELSDRRRILATLAADAEQLAKRRELAAEKIRPAARNTWAAVLAALGFAIGTAVGGWDIGLFAAVIISGLTLIAFKFLHQDAESKLDSVIGAQTMSEARIKEAKDRIARIEELLSPLAGFSHLDDALSKYQAYVTAVAELAELDRPDGEVELRKARAYQQQLAELERQLPAGITAHEPAEIQRQLEQLAELQARHAQAQEALRDYAEGGAQALEIAELESRLTAMNAELAAKQALGAELAAAHVTQRAQLESRARELEMSVGAANSVHRISDELAVVTRRIEELVRESADLLVSGDPERLSLEWSALAAQRDELKRLELESSRLPAPDELQAREILLIEELDDVKDKLAQLDPLYLLQGSVADYAAKYARQYRTAAESVDINDAAILAAQAELQQLPVERLSAEIAALPPRDELRADLGLRQLELEQLQSEINTARGLADAVKRELAELDRRFLTDLQQQLSSRVAQFTDNAFTGVVLHDGELNVVLPDGSTRGVNRLSDGVADLVWCAVRVAVLERLHAVDDSPLVWDEPFARLDERRLQRVREGIQRVAAGRQVILLTRDARLQSWGATAALDDRTAESAATYMSA